MEEEAKKSDTNLADMVTKLALTSKDADTVLKTIKGVQSTCMNNEVNDFLLNVLTQLNLTFHLPFCP